MVPMYSQTGYNSWGTLKESFAVNGIATIQSNQFQFMAKCNAQ